MKKSILFVAALMAPISAAYAAPVASSFARDVEIDLTVLNAAGVSVGPLSSASGTAPPAYTDSDVLLGASAGANVSAGGLLSTDLAVATEISETSASGSLATATAQSGTAINGLSLDLVQTAIGIAPVALLTVGAETITSTSQANAAGTPTAFGTSSIENLQLGGLLLEGITIDLGVFAGAAANTVLLDSDLLGIEIILNEQIDLGDGVTSAGIQTSAIHVSLSDFLLGTDLISGDIYIARTRAFVEAAVQDVPAPAALGLFGLAGLALAAARRRRKD